MQSTKLFIQNGGMVKGIVSISRVNIERAWMQLDIGEDLRHSDQIHEVFMLLGDKQQSISAMNIGVQEYTLDTPITAFWSDNPTYAENLLEVLRIGRIVAPEGSDRSIKRVLLDAYIHRADALLPVSYTHLRAHETVLDLVCRLLL